MTAQPLFTKGKDFWDRHRHGLRRLLVLLIAGFVAWSLLWWLAARHIHFLATDWIDQRELIGDVITYEKMQINGFPTTWELHLATLSWQQNSAFGPQTLRSPEVELSTSLADLGIIKLARPADVTWHQKVPLNTIQLSGELTDFQLDLAQTGSLPTGRLQARTVQAALAKGALTAQQLNLNWQASRDGGQDVGMLQLDLRGITLPENAVLNNRSGGRLTAHFDLIGDLGDGGHAGLAAWRDSGGAIELRKLAVDFPPMTLNGDATVTLDQNLQPTAAGRFDVGGINTVIRSAAERGLLTPRAAALAQLIIAGLSMKNRTPGNPKVRLPVSIQAGKIWLGPAAIAKMPTLRW